MVYNVHMETRKNGKPNFEASKFRILIIAGFVILLVAICTVVILTGRTGYARAIDLAGMNSTEPPSVSPIPTLPPTPSPEPTDSPVESESPAPSYVKTSIVVDGDVFATLASRQAATELINNVVLHFELMCATEGLSTEVRNTVELIPADDTVETISYDSAYTLLTGEDSPLEVVSQFNRSEITIIPHAVNIINSDDFYLGTRFVESYGRDGKNMRMLEYTYINGVLSETLVLEELSLFPAVIETVIVGTRPIPEDDTASPDFNIDDCPFTERNFRRPVQCEVVTYFGFIGGVMHSGIDYSVTGNTQCKAAAAGTVISIMRRGAYGLVVEISHGDGFVTRYAGLSSAIVAIGDIVSIGDQIGFVDTEGLHFELLLDGRPRNPVVYLLRLFD